MGKEKSFFRTEEQILADIRGDEDIIEEQYKYFNFYFKFPTIITAIYGVIFFLLGIVFMATDMVGIGCGVWMGGAIGCLITYYCLKVVFSQAIIQVGFLSKISHQMALSNKQIIDVKEQLKQIEQQEKSE